MIYLAGALILSAGLFFILALQTRVAGIESRSKPHCDELIILYHGRSVSIEEMLHEIILEET